jgi:hypothetical protein
MVAVMSHMSHHERSFMVNYLCRYVTGDFSIVNAKKQVRRD